MRSNLRKFSDDQNMQKKQTKQLEYIQSQINRI